MKKLKYQIKKQNILPGFGEGRYEPPHVFNRKEFAEELKELERRDRRVHVRISASDLRTLEREALQQGIPTQSLLANIIHQYAVGGLEQKRRSRPVEQPSGESGLAPSSGKPADDNTSS